MIILCSSFFTLASSHSFFFFKDTAPTEIYTLSLHDALPISNGRPHRTARHWKGVQSRPLLLPLYRNHLLQRSTLRARSEEHTSELQSLAYLVCRLLLEKKKKNKIPTTIPPRRLSYITTITVS